MNYGLNNASTWYNFPNLIALLQNSQYYLDTFVIFRYVIEVLSRTLSMIDLLITKKNQQNSILMLEF